VQDSDIRLAADIVIQERYRIVRLIGQGGMGAVYEAIDERLGKTVALKQTLVSNLQTDKAFEREAKLLASLHHVALPDVTDYFSADKGLFLVMEFISGEDLGTLLAQRKEPFAVEYVLRWADQLLDALDYLHTQPSPIIHRDIKPQNLKLTLRDEIILLDFGLAKGSGSQAALDTNESIFGYTPQYAPLEQIQGTGTDPRSDLYALAATLYTLLTGEPPANALVRSIAKINNAPDPLLPAHQINPLIPVKLGQILVQALQLNADKRPPNAAAMRAALQEAYRTSVADGVTLFENTAQSGNLVADDRVLVRIRQQDRRYARNDYEIALLQLLDQLGKDRPRQVEALTYQYRLLENIDQCNRYGDTNELKSDRARIIDQLNKLALSVLGISFNKLMTISATPGASTPPPPDETKTQKIQVFISYKRHARPDELLAKRLVADLAQAGHTVFIDQTMKVGVEWASEIRRQIEASEYVVVLLSAASVGSEMLAMEIEYAQEQFLRTGRRKARLLPVRVDYTDPLPYQLSLHLDKLQYAEWKPRTRDSTRRMVAQLLDAIGYGEKLPSLYDATMQAVTEPVSSSVPQSPWADPRFIEELDDPGGALRLLSEFYIERDADKILRRELSKLHGTTTTIRAARQTGKTSLLMRGVAQAQTRKNQAVFLDLQTVDNPFFQTQDAFLHYCATFIVTKLGMDVDAIERIWSNTLGAPDKITQLMEEYILPQIGTKLVLAIDEADLILKAAFHTNFFGLLRAWHNKRAIDDRWDKLDMLLVISTDPHLIKDFYQSPFNVGIRIALDDFDEMQTQELHRRYKSPLRQPELSALIDLLSGHPYLTNRALYTIVTQEMTWDEFARIAGAEKGPFGDHLRHYLWILRGQPRFTDAIRQVIQHGRCSDQEAYYQLTKAGLIKEIDSRSCICRCKLYEDYFRSKI
jgi:serine/threonine protein kinase